MKYKYLFSIVFSIGVLFSDEIPESPIEKQTLNESFSYTRLVYFAFGVEVALGHRFRSEHFGWGPNINVAASPLVSPSMLLNFEVLYYPESWDNGYWGMIPGIGVARWIKSAGNMKYVMTIWAGLELIFGKEFYKNGKRRFHQLSVGPYYMGYNYGWAF